MNRSPLNPVSRLGAIAATLSPTFWLLFLIVLLDRATFFVIPFMTLYLTQSRGLTPQAAGAVLTFWGAGVLAASLAGGMLADRFGTRLALVVSRAGAGLCLAAFLFRDEFLWLAIIGCAYGLTAEMAKPVIAAATADLVPPRQRIFAYGTLFFAANIGAAIGPLLAAALIAVGWSLMFGAQAGALVLGGAISFAAFRKPLETPRASDRALPAMVKALTDRRMMALFGATLTMHLIWQQAYLTLPLVMRDQGLAAADYGLVLTANGVLVALLTAPVTALAARWTTTFRIAVGLVVIGLGFGAHAAASTVWQYGICTLIWSAGEVLFSTSIQEAAAEIAPPARRATYQGVTSSSRGVAVFVGPVLAGLGYASLTAPVFWLVCGTLAVSVAVIFTFAMQRLSGSAQT